MVHAAECARSASRPVEAIDHQLPAGSRTARRKPRGSASGGQRSAPIQVEEAERPARSAVRGARAAFRIECGARQLRKFIGV